MNFSNNSIRSLLNSVYGLNLPSWPSKFKALHNGRPPYLSDLLQHHEPTRSLCSSSSHQVSVPHHNLSFGSRTFRYSAPRVWNSLPVSIRESQSLPKDILLSVSLPHFSCPLTVCTVVCCKGHSNKYRKWHSLGCCRRETPQPIYIKFGMGDYVWDAIQYTKWHVNRFRG